MDRGFHRPVNDRVYDNFYSDNRRGGNQGGGFKNNQQRPQSQNNRNSGGHWAGPPNRDPSRGFFGQVGGNQPGMQSAALPAALPGNLNGQMLATLKQQQNLLNAFMSNNQARPRPQQNAGRFNQSPNNNRNVQHRNNQRGSKPVDNNNKRRNASIPASHPAQNKKPRPQTHQSPKRKEKEIVVEIEIADDEVEISDSLMDSVEELRRRGDKIERNVADEDIDKLVVFSFTGKGYHCKTCEAKLTTKESFKNHISGNVHVMKVIESRTKKTYQEVRDILDINLSPDDWYETSETAKKVILNQAKQIMRVTKEKELLEKANYNKNPANFFSVTLETRKSAFKCEDKVTITSLVESQMEVKEFAGDKFFGCEFVKAVSGFQCRLCDTFIKDPTKVVLHINDRVHKNNYEAYKKKHPNYEKQQKQQNVELAAILSEEEGKNVMLSQTPGIASSPFLMQIAPSMVEIKKLTDPPAKKVEETTEEETKVEEEKKDGEDNKEEAAEEKKDEEKAAEETTKVEEQVEEVNKPEEKKADDVIEVPMEDEPAKEEESKEETPALVADDKKKSATTPVQRGRGRGRGRGSPATPRRSAR